MDEPAEKRSPVFKICHTYPTLEKLLTVIPYLKKIPNTDKSRDTFLFLQTSTCFHQKTSNFCFIKKHKYRLHFNARFLILSTFFWFYKNCFDKYGCTLMISTKLDALALLKINVFLKKSYNVIIYAHEQQNFITWVNVTKVWLTLAFLWEKLLQPKFYKDLTRKIIIFVEHCWFK